MGAVPLVGVPEKSAVGRAGGGGGATQLAVPVSVNGAPAVGMNCQS